MAKTACSTPTPITTRRTLGAGLFATIIGSGITAGAAASIADFVPADPDAELIAICSEAETADRLMNAALQRHKALKRDPVAGAAARAECDHWFERFVDLADEAAGIPARTIEGMRSKARVAFLNISEISEEKDLTFLVLRDLGWGA